MSDCSETVLVHVGGGGGIPGVVAVLAQGQVQYWQFAAHIYLSVLLAYTLAASKYTFQCCLHTLAASKYTFQCCLHSFSSCDVVHSAISSMSKVAENSNVILIPYCI